MAPLRLPFADGRSLGGGGVEPRTYHRYYGPSNPLGAVNAWPDSGDAPLITALATPPVVAPTCVVGLNGLRVGRLSGTPCGVDGPPALTPAMNARNYTMAHVVRIGEGPAYFSQYFGMWDYFGGSFQYVQLIVSKSSVLGRNAGWSIERDADNANGWEQFLLKPITTTVVAAVIAVSGQGAVEVTYSADWGGEETLSIPVGGYQPRVRVNAFFVGTSQSNVGSLVEAAESRFYCGQAMDADERLAVLEELRATWE